MTVRARALILASSAALSLVAASGTAGGIPIPDGPTAVPAPR